MANEIAKTISAQKRKATREANALRHSNMLCRTYQLKLDMSQLSKKQKNAIFMMFVEAKWAYNDAVAWLKSGKKLSDWDYSKRELTVITKDGLPILRELNYVTPGCVQAIKEEIGESLKSIKTNKKRRKKKTEDDDKKYKLHYQKEHTSLTFKQLEKNGKRLFIRGRHTLKIPTIDGLIKCNGLQQITPEMELAEAKLLNTPLGYYVHITVYQPKAKGGENEELLKGDIGIDLGIATTITMSNGEKRNVTIGESERLKTLQREMFRRKKGSNNRKKTQKLLDREYQRISNRKEDVANKIVHYLLRYEHVCMQDENLRGWHSGLFGKQVQHSALGRIKAKLLREDRSDRVFCLDSRVPTTQYCPICGRLNKHDLSERTYRCSCDYEQDRDVHAAQNMVLMVREGYPLKDKKDKKAEEKLKALYRVRQEMAEFTPMEIGTSTMDGSNATHGKPNLRSGKVLGLTACRHYVE